jgi:16S rRNA processing protein RimM
MNSGNSPKQEKGEWIEIGKLGSAHGIQGEIKLFSSSDVPGRFENLKQVWWEGQNGEKKRLTVSTCRPCERFFLIRFNEVKSREEAANLANGSLFLIKKERGQLPENQYFIDDIIGLKVEDEAGHLIGIVEDIYQTGANDIYMITTSNGEKLIPAIDKVIININILTGKMIIRMPEGY